MSTCLPFDCVDLAQTRLELPQGTNQSTAYVWKVSAKLTAEISINRSSPHPRGPQLSVSAPEYIQGLRKEESAVIKLQRTKIRVTAVSALAQTVDCTVEVSSNENIQNRCQGSLIQLVMLNTRQIK